MAKKLTIALKKLPKYSYAVQPANETDECQIIAIDSGKFKGLHFHFEKVSISYDDDAATIPLTFSYKIDIISKYERTRDKEALDEQVAAILYNIVENNANMEVMKA